jgi:CRISPR-associated protein Csm3
MNKQIVDIKITVLTGLHIGIGGDKAQIGGIDNPVIKDPVSKLPYIPGSSLKGKLRCLLETEHSNEDDFSINNFFGPTTNFLNKKLPGFSESSSRIIFRDVFLTDDLIKKFESGEWQLEAKTEIKIKRSTGTAESGALRTSERVPPSSIFVGSILVRYNEKKAGELVKILELLKTSIGLLSKDALGGSGSRGYGAVKVEHNIDNLISKANSAGN